MKYLDQVYIRLSDGLIVFPVQGKDSQLFNWFEADEPPITIHDLKHLDFVLLRDIISKPVETTNEEPKKCTCPDDLEDWTDLCDECSKNIRHSHPSTMD